MIERPERQIDEFAEAGADSITIQVEATPNVHYALMQIRDAGCLAGLAINPATPVEAVAELHRRRRPRALHDGQPGLGRTGLHRAFARQGERLREVLGRVPDPGRRRHHAATGRRRCEAGASLFVAGSAIFGAADPAAAYSEIARRGRGRVAPGDQVPSSAAASTASISSVEPGRMCCSTALSGRR